MTNPHAHRLSEMVDAARAHAAIVEHPWDARALDWPDLTPTSVVVEVGGYVGRWALQIAERYHPQLFVFEPQPWAHAVCQVALGDAAYVFPYGLGDQDGEFRMGQWESDGCSFLKESSLGGVLDPVARMHEIGATFKRLEIGTPDLLLMNIEGYEYTLLPHMLDAGILPKRIMVQFHTFMDPQGMALAQLYARLEVLGYQVLWTYGVVLTAWERV